jgi:hypothetical protein
MPDETVAAIAALATLYISMDLIKWEIERTVFRRVVQMSMVHNSGCAHV